MMPVKTGIDDGHDHRLSGFRHEVPGRVFIFGEPDPLDRPLVVLTGAPGVAAVAAGAQVIGIVRHQYDA